MINIQPIEKYIRAENKMLDVHSIFHTIQGEGPFTGHPAVFVRLAGCNLKCPGCDTDYTSTRTQQTPEEIVAKVRQYGTTLVVITGGEPFRQHNIRYLIEELVKFGINVQIETNGTLAPVVFKRGSKEGYLYSLNPQKLELYGKVYIVVSPKAGRVNPLIWKYACCVKYVVRADDVANDGLPIHALNHPVRDTVARPPEDWDRTIYVQPMDEQNELLNAINLQTAIRSCMAHNYVLQIQTHKIINME